MHRVLKARLWREIDRSLADSFACKPVKKSSVWRLYKLTQSPASVFITAEYFDRAGGLFTFCFGKSSGAWPSQLDAPDGHAHVWPHDGFTFMHGEILGHPSALVSVELDWQTPSAQLVHQALAIPSAQEMLAQLSVTRDSNHNILSHGILEALGVVVPDSEFDPIFERFSAELTRVMQSSIVPCANALLVSSREHR